MAEDPKTSEYSKAELASVVVLIGFMLASKELAGFTNDNHIVTAASLTLKATAYLQQYSPNEVDKFYRQVRSVLDGVAL